MFADVLRFWFDRGVEGFRVDAVWPGRQGARPARTAPPLGPGEFNPYTCFRPRATPCGGAGGGSWTTTCADHPGRDLMMVAEAYAPRRPGPDRRVHPARRVPPVLRVRPAAVAVARRVDAHGPSPRRSTRRGPQGTGPRSPSTTTTPSAPSPASAPEASPRADAWTGDNLHYLDGYARPRRSAPAGPGRPPACCSALPGAVYLYMGEELGLPEVLDLPDEAREDPMFFRTGGAARAATAAASRCRGRRTPDDAYGFSATGRPRAVVPPAGGLGAVRRRPPGRRRVVDAGAVPAADRGAPRASSRRPDAELLDERRRPRRRSAGATSSSPATSGRSRPRSPPRPA